MREWMIKQGLLKPPKVSPEVEALVKKVDKTLAQARVEFDDLKLELMLSTPVNPRRKPTSAQPR
jgi:hypothetical protein